MKNNTQVYVLTLNAPSRKTVRLWTGASIHSLRHCSSKKIDCALVEMQQPVDDLQRAIACWRPGDRTPPIALDNVLQSAGDIHREGVQPSCRMI